MSKYSIPDDHKWQQDKEQRKREAAQERDVHVDTHSVSVVHHYGDSLHEKKKYQCNIHEQEDGTKVVYNVIPHRFKGNYYRQAEFDSWMDFHDVPNVVRKEVAKTVERSVEELTPEYRTHTEGDE